MDCYNMDGLELSDMQVTSQNIQIKMYFYPWK